MMNIVAKPPISQTLIENYIAEGVWCRLHQQQCYTSLPEDCPAATPYPRAASARWRNPGQSPPPGQARRKDRKSDRDAICRACMMRHARNPEFCRLQAVSVQARHDPPEGTAGIPARKPTGCPPLATAQSRPVPAARRRQRSVSRPTVTSGSMPVLAGDIDTIADRLLHVPVGRRWASIATASSHQGQPDTSRTLCTGGSTI